MKPMLAKLVDDIPPGLLYEPKWDGFRAIVVKEGDAIEIHSRNGKPMARYFPDQAGAELLDVGSPHTVFGSVVLLAWTAAALAGGWIRHLRWEP